MLGGVESQRSPSLLVMVTGSATTTSVSLEQSAPLSQPMSCATDRPAVCYAVQFLANGLGPVSALSPIPDGRVMFIEDGQQIRIVARDAGSSFIALPAEPGRQLTGLAIDTQFAKSRSAFVAWSEFARGAPGLNITRYREVENVLGEGAWDKFKNLKRLVDEVSARPAAQKALTLKDRHKFKTEMDQEALHAMFPHLKEKVA